MSILNLAGKDLDREVVNAMLRHWLAQSSVRDSIAQHVPSSKHPTPHEVHTLYFSADKQGLEYARAAAIVRTLVLCKPVRARIAAVVSSQRGLDPRETARELVEFGRELKTLAQASKAGLEVASTMPRVRGVRIG